MGAAGAQRDAVTVALALQDEPLRKPVRLRVQLAEADAVVVDVNGHVAGRLAAASRRARDAGLAVPAEPRSAVPEFTRKPP